MAPVSGQPTTTAKKSLEDRLKLEKLEGNAQFLKFLEAVYSTSKKLETEVAAAANTRKDIKVLVASLANSIKGLIHWGRSTGRVMVATNSRGCQTEMMEEKPKKGKATQTDMQPQETTETPLERLAETSESETFVPSPDRTRFEFNGAIKEVKNMLKKQSETVEKLVTQIEVLQQKQQQQKQQRQPHKQQRQPQQQQRKQPQSPQRRQPQQQQQQQQPQSPQRRQPQQQQQQTQQQTWSEVVRRKKAKTQVAPQQQKSSVASKISLLRRRAPKTAAVTIDRPGEGGSLAAVMKKVSSTIDLAALGIRVSTTRRTRAGGVLLEVVGADKAATLAGKLRAVVGDDARVRLPESLTPILILDVPEWADAEEVAEALVEAGVSVGSTKRDGTNLVFVRKNAGGRGDRVARINLPFSEAIKLAEARSITVGWTRCRVKPLEKGQPTCFRCQGKGHLAAGCKNQVRGRQCHGCGGEGHLIKDCKTSHKEEEERQQGDKGQSKERLTVSESGSLAERSVSPVLTGCAP